MFLRLLSAGIDFVLVIKGNRLQLSSCLPCIIKHTEQGEHPCANYNIHAYILFSMHNEVFEKGIPDIIELYLKMHLHINAHSYENLKLLEETEFYLNFNL